MNSRVAISYVYEDYVFLVIPSLPNGFHPDPMSLLSGDHPVPMLLTCHPDPILSPNGDHPEPMLSRLVPKDAPVEPNKKRAMDIVINAFFI